ncbi:MAG: TonB-dependent receptor plug domain-containing protein [Bacteroidales bacterium]|nr:TonB-dependent receptor plug domain-containing protein [Bacteroidales bacterium]
MKKCVPFCVVLMAVFSACGTQRGAMSSQQDEQIDVGYGLTTRRNSSYAVGKVDVEKIQNVAYTSIFDYLRSRVAGVQVGYAAPGETPDISIRGINSINSSTQPIFVVDGMQVSSIADINPNDVKSITVLKDAAASVYGVRGANGVIQITTKSGR